MKNFWWPQAEAGEDAGGGGIDPAAGRKAFVDEEVRKRYKPRDVRELLAKHGDNAEVALEHAVAHGNDVVERLMRRQAELEHDLAAAKAVSEATEAKLEALAAERDAHAAKLEVIEADKRAARVEVLLKERFADDALVRLHRAFLKAEGYEVDLEGDNVMLTKGGKRQRFDTVVNDDFYATYPEAKPKGDDALPQGGTSASKGDIPLSKQASSFYATQEQQAQDFLTPPKGP